MMVVVMMKPEKKRYSNTFAKYNKKKNNGTNTINSQTSTKESLTVTQTKDRRIAAHHRRTTNIKHKKRKHTDEKIRKHRKLTSLGKVK